MHASAIVPDTTTDRRRRLRAELDQILAESDRRTAALAGERALLLKRSGFHRAAAEEGELQAVALAADIAVLSNERDRRRRQLEADLMALASPSIAEALARVERELHRLRESIPREHREGGQAVGWRVTASEGPSISRRIVALIELRCRLEALPLEAVADAELPALIDGLFGALPAVALEPLEVIA